MSRGGLSLLLLFVLACGLRPTPGPNEAPTPGPSPTPWPWPSSHPAFGVLIVYFDPGLDLKRAEAVLDAAVAVHAQWVRIGFIWALAEPQPGVYNLAPFDDLIGRALNRGLRVLPVVTGTPAWASARPDAADPYAFPPTAQPIPATGGDGYAALTAFAAHIAAHYRGRITAWEFWNEPDMPPSLHDLDGDGTSADEYAAMLAAFAAGIRQGDPQAQVVLGGLAQGSPETGCTPGYLEALLRDPAHPAGEVFDILNFHTNFLFPAAMQERIAANQATVRRWTGAEVPVWVTETSYPSDPPHQNLAAYRGGEAAQARYVRDALAAQWAAGAQVVFWATLHDDRPTTSESDPYKHAGLYTYDLRPKAAAHALAQWLQP